MENDETETGHPRIYKKQVHQTQYERETDIQSVVDNARSLVESIFGQRDHRSKLYNHPNAENLAIALRLSIERYDQNEALRSS